MERLKQIALDYFDAHPEAKKVVIEKGKILLRDEWQNTHHYEWNTKLQDTVCWVCGQSRYSKDLTRCPGFEARHGKKSESMVDHIKDVLRREHELFQQTIKNCEAIVKKQFKSLDEINGADMARLHSTHGCDPETLEDIFQKTISVEKYNEYKACMEQERALSRSKQKKEIIHVNQS